MLFRRGISALRSFCALDECRCSFCREPFVPASEPAVQRLFCPSCRTSFLRREAGFCPHCGEPSAVDDAPVVPCGECLQQLPPWDDFLFYGIYEGSLRELILKAKFGGSLSALNALGKLLAELCAEHYTSAPLPHVIVPVPLHPSRLRERGLDQCLELVRPLAKALHLPIAGDLLFRVIATNPQARLSRELRRELRQPFEASPEVCGLRILLVDDVCTTGATVRRAAECLLAAGAASVSVAVVARASRHSAPRREAE
ncbi:MAG: ComF family protein [Mailhella sp.]|nr:ComF family protein [Mailhella sp.]